MFVYISKKISDSVFSKQTFDFPTHKILQAFYTWRLLYETWQQCAIYVSYKNIHEVVRSDPSGLHLYFITRFSGTSFSVNFCADKLPVEKLSREYPRTAWMYKTLLLTDFLIQRINLVSWGRRNYIHNFKPEHSTTIYSNNGQKQMYMSVCKE
jgi:hypothetical protein